MNKDLIAKFLEKHNKIKEVTKQRLELKNLEKELKNELGLIEWQLREELESQKLEAIRLDNGITLTIDRQVKYNAKDWELVYKFIKDKDSFYLLKKEIKQASIKELKEAISEDDFNKMFKSYETSEIKVKTNKK